MKRLTICTVGLFFLVAAPLFADTDVLLRQITKQESLSATRLILSFSELPAYRLETSGQRIDLFLAQTAGAAGMSSLPEDGKVVRILLGQEKEQLMASFLLRTVPQSVKVLTDPKISQLTLLLSWMDDGGPGRLAIAPRLRGAPRLQAGGTVMKLGEQTSYRQDWRQFFSGGESPLRVSVPLIYTLAPLPRLVYQPLTEGPLGAALVAGVGFVQEERWREALTVLQRIPEAQLTGVDREALQGFYAESLVRSGQYPEAKKSLEAFCETFADSALSARMRYLFSYVNAVLGHPYDAMFQLSLLNQEAADKAYYMQIGALLQAEIELTVGHQDKALEILSSQAFPAAVVPIKERRLADALAVVGRYGEALQKYRALEQTSRIGIASLFSLERLAETLYQEKDYAEAVSRYGELLNQVSGEENSSLVQFAQARSFLRAGNVSEALSLLRDVTSFWPETEGSRRARMLLLDQEVLADMEGRSLQAIPQLLEIAAQATSREVREEATFKRLLLGIVQHPDLAGVNGCEEFLKRFGQSRYIVYVDGLLNEILPPVIQDLINHEQYLDALVLLEKHRHRLVSGVANHAFLRELSEAFRRLGLLDKAATVYSYMLDAYQGQPVEEPFYLPLVQLLEAQGDARQTLDYADRYLARYPAGRDASAILLLKIDALHDQGRNEDAAKILTSAGLPPSLDLDLLAGKIFWALSRPEQVGFFLSRSLDSSEKRQEHADAALLLAEALFQQKKWDGALPLYREMQGLETFSDQARYRSAQILLNTGKRDEALNFLRLLVEEGKSSQWQKLAESTLLSERSGKL